MSLLEEASCSDPWDKVVQGGLSLACTAQRYSVLKTGERVLEVAFGDEHGLVERLSARLMDNVKAVIDVNDDYEWNQLVRVLGKIMSDPVRLREIAEWGLTSTNEEVRADARDLLGAAS